MLESMGKALGIDYGSKRIGIALSDEDRKFAFPKEIVANGSDVVNKVTVLVREEGVTDIVVGESIDFAGNDNPIMEQAREFVGLLEQAAGARVIFEPEILTSAQARRQFQTKEKTRKPQTRETVDASAAALILQTYLDKQA